MQLALFLCIVVTLVTLAKSFQLHNRRCAIRSSLSSHRAYRDREEGFLDLFSDSMDEVEGRTLKVEGGTLPSYLRGNLLRNGPGCFGEKGQEGQEGEEGRRYSHIFDGLAKLTSFVIGEHGELTFSSKFLKSGFYKTIVEEKKPIPPSVTTGPVVPPWTSIESVKAALTSSIFDNVPVNLHQLAGPNNNNNKYDNDDATSPVSSSSLSSSSSSRKDKDRKKRKKRWVGVTDAPVLVEFDPDTLETIGRLSYQGDTAAGGYELFSTAHPKSIQKVKKVKKVNKVNSLAGTEEVKGEQEEEQEEEHESVNYFLELGLSSNTAVIAKIDSHLQRHIVGKVPLGFGEIPYVHDFSVTHAGEKRLAVLTLFPFRISVDKLVTGKGFLSQLQWGGDEFDSEMHALRSQSQSPAQPAASVVPLAQQHRTETLLYVFDLDSTDSQPIASYIAPPLWAYHHINCYYVEKDKSLVLDVSGYDKPDIVNGEHGFALIPNMRDKAKRGKQTAAAECYRYNLPLPANFPHASAVSATRASRGSDTSETNGSGKGTTNTATPYVATTSAVKLPAMDSSGYVYDQELCRISPRVEGQKHRYSYGFTGFAGEHHNYNSEYGSESQRIDKVLNEPSVDVVEGVDVSGGVDVNSRRGGFEEWALVKLNHNATSESKSTSAQVWHEEQCYPSEPIFVPEDSLNAPKTYCEEGFLQDEDKGVLLSQVYDGKRRETFLLVLDAGNMREVCRAYTGHRVPISFHGQWLQG